MGAYQQASRNASQASSIYNIAEGAATSIQGMLNQMKQLATEAASDTVDSNGRAAINAEFTQLQSEIDRTVNTTTFQGSKLISGGFGATVNKTGSSALLAIAGVDDVKLSGTAAGTYSISESGNSATMSNTSNGVTTTQTQTVVPGAGKISFSQFGITIDTGSASTVDASGAKRAFVDAGAVLDSTTLVVDGGSATFLVGASGQYATNDTLSLNGGQLDLSTSTLGIGSSSVDTLANAQAALTALDSAITSVNSTLGTIGAGQNRLTNAISNLSSTVQNYQAAEGTIKDVDMASEMVSFSKNQILAQAGTAMLAQANQAGSSVLKLLQ